MNFMLLLFVVSGGNFVFFAKLEKQKLVFKTDYRLMQVKSIAECSKRAFCNSLDLH